MFFQGKSSVLLLDLLHGGVVAHIKDGEWIEGLEGLDGHDHLEVLDPDEPEEGSDDSLKIEAFVEDRGA